MSRSARTSAIIVTGAIVLAAYGAHVWYFAHYVNDDAFITYRYSRSLAAGQGPYFNPGQHVEGYTNFLLMLVLAGVCRVAGADAIPAAAKVIGIVGGLAALLAAWALTTRWLRRVHGLAEAAPLLAWFAPALVVVNSAYAVNSTSGLETTLFSGWLLVGLWLTERSRDTGRWHGAGIAFGLAALTRPEGLPLAIAVLGTALRASGWRNGAVRKALLLDGGVVVAVVAAQLAFRLWAYDGAWLPNTYYAKAGGFSEWRSAQNYLREFAWSHLGRVVGPLALLPLVAAPASTLRRATLPALACCAAAVVALLSEGSDWMMGYRLLVPYTPVWAALVVAGAAAAAERWAAGAWRVAAAVCAVALVLVSLQQGRRAEYRALCDESAQSGSHAALAAWLHTHAAPGDLVALMDIGQVGFRNPELRILDITGLTDARIARSPGTFLHKDYDPAYVLDQAPRYIVLVTTRARTGDDDYEYMPWTPTETRLLEHPAFQRHYFHERTAQGEDDYEQLAGYLGAECVFHHRTKRMLYLLTVYERRE